MVPSSCTDVGGGWPSYRTSDSDPPPSNGTALFNATASRPGSALTRANTCS